MTTDTDKLVEMLRASGAEEAVEGLFYVTAEKAAAFRAAIIADLCGNVEPVAWIYWHPSDTSYDGPDTLHKKAVSRFTDDTRKAMLAKGWLFEPLYPATVAALKAENEALRKDAERYQHIRANYMPPVSPDTWDALDEALALGGKELDAAIDAAITARGKT